MSAAQELPIFPLGSPLLPQGRLALRIFEPRYVAMTEDCLREDAVFGVSLIRAGFEVGVPAIPCEIGCTARIVDSRQIAPARYALTCLGETRFRILSRRVTDSGLIYASVEELPPQRGGELPQRYAGFAAMLSRLAQRLGAEYFATTAEPDNAAWVALRMAELLPVTPEQRQRWLESDSALPVLEEQLAVLAGLDRPS